MGEFVNLCNLINLIKTPTWFKGTGSCIIGLLLTYQKYSFKNTNAFETGLSDNHFLNFFMLETSFQKNELKRVVCRDNNSFPKDSFLTNLSNSV